MLDAEDKIKTLGRIIANDERYIKQNVTIARWIIPISVVTTLILAYFGIIEKVFPDLKSYSTAISIIPTIAGPAFGGFTLRDYYVKQNRIVWLDSIKMAFEKCKSNPDAYTPEEKARIEDNYNKVLVNDVNR